MKHLFATVLIWLLIITLASTIHHHGYAKGQKAQAAIDQALLNSCSAELDLARGALNDPAYD